MMSMMNNCENENINEWNYQTDKNSENNEIMSMKTHENIKKMLFFKWWTNEIDERVKNEKNDENDVNDEDEEN